MSIYINVLVRIASLLSRQDELVEDKVQHLPSFLEALSCIVEEMDEVCRRS